MDINSPKDVWDKFKKSCLKVDQDVVYFVLQEILNYPCIQKPKRYDKSTLEIFAKVRFFYKQLKVVMTAKRNLFDIIIIIIILDTLYSNFKTTIANMLETGDKSIEVI